MIRFTGANGNMLAADFEGDVDGRAVLFLHGGGQTRHAWRGAQRALSSLGYFSISLDARGHGDSDWVKDKNYALEAFADDVLAVVDQLSRPVAIVGASLGGLTALVALARKPALPCNGIVLVDVVPRPNPSGVEQILAFMAAHQDGFVSLDEAAEAVAFYLPGRARPPSAKGLQKNLRLRDNGRYHWHWDPGYLDWRDDILLYGKQMDDVLRGARTPLMLVRGLGSNVVTDDEVAEFRSLAPHATVVDIRDAGHMVAGDENDAFTDAVVEFLLSSSPKPTA